jgi:hypothetical protein
MGVNVLLLSTARGSGLAVNNKPKQETFMKMASAGAGLAGVYCGFGRQISKSSFFVYFKASGWYYPRWVVCSSSSFSTLAKACCAKVCFEST